MIESIKGSVAKIASLSLVGPETGYFSFITSYTVVFLKIPYYCLNMAIIEANLLRKYQKYSRFMVKLLYLGGFRGVSEYKASEFLFS